MKALLRHMAVLCAALPLLGCPSTPTYLAQPEALSTSGAFVHAASGMIFPDRVDGFRRVELRRYDKDGLDVSAGYNLVDPNSPVVATVYVYPAPPLLSIGSPPDVVASAREHLCETEFARRKAEIVHVHPGAQLIGEGDVAFPREHGSAAGKKATYEFDDVFGGTRQRLSSELYVFCYIGEKWAIEYRFTAPRDAPSTEKISAFMNDLPWTIPSGS